MLHIVYDSQTGLGKKFAEKLPYPSQSVDGKIELPCILITRNSGLGQIPKSTQLFLSQNSAYVKGVVVNGSKRFGMFYCAAVPKIEKQYRIPVIRKIEGEGTKEDVDAVIRFLQAQQLG